MRTGVLLRTGTGLIAFVLAALGAVAAWGNFANPQAAAGTFPMVVALGLGAAVVVVAGLERAQTGRLTSFTGPFTTRVLVLMPAAIAMNVVLGQAVGSALKLPVYLDSLGTILVGVLAGPVPGAVTGLLSNLLWQYVLPPPFQSPTAAAFCLTATEIGLVAGTAARLGAFRPRPNTPLPRLIWGGIVALVVLVVLATASYLSFYQGQVALFSADQPSPVLLAFGVVALAALAAAVSGFFALLVARRDLTVAVVVAAGALTGFISALLSAPVAASLFGGVTGAGTDFVVAFFRQQGASVLAASFEQSLLSDPVDKLSAFLVVYVVVQGIPPRLLARFPQGTKLLARDPHG